MAQRQAIASTLTDATDLTSSFCMVSRLGNGPWYPGRFLKRVLESFSMMRPTAAFVAMPNNCVYGLFFLFFPSVFL